MILNLTHLVHNAFISSVKLASSDITNLSTAENKILTSLLKIQILAQNRVVLIVPPLVVLVVPKDLVNMDIPVLGCELLPMAQNAGFHLHS